VEETQSTAPAPAAPTSALGPSVESSRGVDQLFAALAKAQGEITAAEKSAMNPHFRRRYADLGSVWDACRAALAKNGLAVLQVPRIASDKWIEVRTILGHSSGQWIAAELAAPAAQMTPQGIGSVITYLRRYTMAPLIGVAPEEDDDDGNAGSGQGDEDAPPARPPERSQRQDPAPPQAPQRAPRRSGAAAAPDPALEALAADFDRRIAADDATLEGLVLIREEIRGAKDVPHLALLEHAFARSIGLLTTPEQRRGLAAEVQKEQLPKDAEARLYTAFKKVAPKPAEPAQSGGAT